MAKLDEDLYDDVARGAALEQTKDQAESETQNILVYNISKKWLQIIKKEKYSISTYIKLAVEAKLREEGKI